MVLSPVEKTMMAAPVNGSENAGERGNVSYCFMLSNVDDEYSVGCAGSMATLPFSLMLQAARAYDWEIGQVALIYAEQRVDQPGGEN